MFANHFGLILPRSGHALVDQQLSMASARGFASGGGKSSTLAPAESNFHSLEGLMGEKERARQEIERIERNKSLTRADKTRAIKQVQGLTRTIDGLIGREKDKISEHYESQLASQVRMSTLNNKQQPQQLGP